MANYMNDPVADLVVTIRNGAAAQHQSVSLFHSNLKEAIVAVLKSEGFVSSYEVSGSKIRKLTIHLKYSGGASVISQIRQISKPGLRRYTAAAEIPKVLGGMGIAVVSTPRGVMTGANAQKSKLGGELVCSVW
jgi:small subunit ribosomal protein S8